MEVEPTVEEPQVLDHQALHQIQRLCNHPEGNINVYVFYIEDIAILIRI